VDGDAFLQPARLGLGLWTIRWSLFLVLGGLLPLLLGVYGPHFGNLPYLVSAGLLVASAWNISSVVTHVQPRLVLLTFWLFVYIWLGLAPLSQMYPVRWPLAGQYVETELLTASLVTLLGVLAWAAGYGWRVRRPAIEATRVVDYKRVRVLAIVGIVIGVAAIARFGPGAFFSSRQEFQDAVESAAGGGPAQGQLLMGLVIVPPTLALFLMLWGRNAIGWAGTTSMRLLTIGLAVVVLVVANPAVNSRFLSGSVIIAMLVATSRRVGSTRFSRQVGSAILVALLLVFPIADFARFADSASGKELGFDRGLFLSGDYDAFQQTVNGVRLVERSGTSAGSQTLGVALFWVPRQVWPGKPEPTGAIIGRDAGYSFVNLSSPAWVEGYVDFLWVGAAAISFALGVLAARLDRAFYGRRFSVWASVAPLYIGYQVIILRGTLMGVVPVLALWAFLTLLVTKRAR
jgi:hypothetical protein